MSFLPASSALWGVAQVNTTATNQESTSTSMHDHDNTSLGYEKTRFLSPDQGPQNTLLTHDPNFNCIEALFSEEDTFLVDPKKTNPIADQKCIKIVDDLAMKNSTPTSDKGILGKRKLIPSIIDERDLTKFLPHTDHSEEDLDCFVDMNKVNETNGCDQNVDLFASQEKDCEQTSSFLDVDLSVLNDCSAVSVSYTHKQRIIECFLFTVLNVKMDQLGHYTRQVMNLSLDDYLFDLIRKSFELPSRCPHGYRIPSAQARLFPLEKEDSLLNLMLRSPKRCDKLLDVVITRIKLENADAIKYLSDRYIVANCCVQIQEHNCGTRIVSCFGDEVFLPSIASNILGVVCNFEVDLECQ